MQGDHYLEREDKIELPPDKKKKSKILKRKYEEEANHHHQSIFILRYHIHNISKDPTKIRLPKVPLEDIRRKYPQMVLNVMNSMDKVLLTNFLEQFTHSETVAKPSVMSRKFHHLELEQYFFYGPKEIFCYLHLANLLTPDRIFRMKKDPSIITNSTTFQTKIMIELEISFTSIFPIHQMPVGQFLTRFHEGNQKLNHQISEEDISQLERIFEKHFQLVRSLPKQNKEESNMTSAVETSSLVPMSLAATSGVAQKFLTRMILIINNVYEREELDELIFQGFYEP